MAEDLGDADDTFGLQRLYQQVHDGPGAAAMQPSVAALSTLSPDMAGSAQRLNTAMRAIGATWQGSAADQTSGAITEVARWAESGGLGARTGGGQVQTYADSFADLKSKVAQPLPVPALTSWGSFWDNFGVMSDHAKTIQRNQQRAADAFQALAVHEQHSNQAVTDFPEVTPPPQVTGRSDGPAGPPSGEPAGGAGLGPGGGGVVSGGGLPDGRAISIGGAPVGGSAGTGAASAGSPVGTGTGGVGAGGPGGGGGTPISVGPGAAPTGRTPLTRLTPGGTSAPGSRARQIGPGSMMAGGRSGSGTSSGAGLTGRGGQHSSAGYSNGGIGEQRAMAPRGGSPSGAPGGAPWDEARGTGAGRAAGGAGGYGPMMGGAGPGGDARTHRNSTFIPSDEPFVVEFADVSAPVLGVSTEDGAK